MPPKLEISAQPKYENPSIVNQALLRDGARENSQEVFPIMSVSKSFCGAVSALMAADGDFGKNGINATLAEVLQQAGGQYPERLREIELYEKMLQKKGISDIKIYELLNHTSGIKEGEAAASSYKDKTSLQFFVDKLERGADRGAWRYNNAAYMLLGEIIGLSSKSGSYKSELQARVLEPLQLTRTADIYDSPEALSRVSRVDSIAGTFGHNGLMVKEAQSYSPLEADAFGRVPLAAGGLCSNIDDMEKYATALGEMVVGRDSLLTASMSVQEEQEIKKREIAKIYEESRAANGYSLGIFVETDKDKTVINHGGGFPANSSNMTAEVPVDPAAKPQVDIFMRQENYIAALLLNPNMIPTLLMKEYLGKHTNAGERDQLSAAFHRAHATHLIEQGNLPQDFLSDDYNKFFDAFAKVSPDIAQHLRENYTQENGAIDNEKLKQDFRNIDDVMKMMSGFESFKTAKREADAMLGNFYFKEGLTDLLQGKSDCKDAFAAAQEKGFDVGKALQENQQLVTEGRSGLKEFQKIILDKIYSSFTEGKVDGHAAAR